MQKNHRALKPLARSQNLIVRELNAELLVYEMERHEVYCLNPTAALVWKACNGQRSVEQIADAIGLETDSPIEAEFVYLILEKLAESHLLVEEPSQLHAAGRMSRRDMMLRLGASAAIALPLVTTLVAPKAAQASTCLSSGATCGTSAECCSGVCSGTVCA